MGTEAFFEEQHEQSEVKAAIVQKYFDAWAKVMIPQAKKHGKKIAYIDLFAGPGRYSDGSASTPLLVLQKAVEHPDLSQMLVSIFNDKDEANTQSLSSEIRRIPGIERLAHRPEVHNMEIGDEIAKDFECMKLVPTLMFVDPWGYKGLSLGLVNSVLKDWGCECVFFFNYNRISMGLSNPLVKKHMDVLFGAEAVAALAIKLEGSTPADRELVVVEALSQALQGLGGRYVLPFRFRNASGTRTSHYLIFVSKHALGYTIMKDIMARESSSYDQGVPSFEYAPATERTPLLFSLCAPLDDLKAMLLRDFAGKTISMAKIFESHNVGKPYVSKNYKDALKALEIEGRIQARPSCSERRKDSFADATVVTFPAHPGAKK